VATVAVDVRWPTRRRSPPATRRDYGVTEEQITTMLVDNPRRYFENVGAY
jgi:hypothetical protein